MNIGYDAKRAYHNGTGLGHYSRTLLNSLAKYYPESDYYLFNPKRSSLYRPPYSNLHEVNPSGFINQLLPSLWRSKRVVRDIRRFQLDLYHGLSHEVPVGIRDAGIPVIVTMHDLIHERFPEQYNAIDVKIYSRKFRYACQHADQIIAISEQTKKDIMEIYGVAEEKISVCYQSCNPRFAAILPESEKQEVLSRYKLPQRFFLFVGSLIERKNLLGVCEAMQMIRPMGIPLVVIGSGKAYKQKVDEYLKKNQLEHMVIFLSESPEAKSDRAFRSAEIFPHVYQSAEALVYPSYFEGFGIPVLEALFSRCPVITSNISSLPEAGGPGAWYVDPANSAEIAQAMKTLANDKELAQSLTVKGADYASNFTTERTAADVMQVYQSL